MGQRHQWFLDAVGVPVWRRSSLRRAAPIQLLCVLPHHRHLFERMTWIARELIGFNPAVP
jgi:hypothetical protein